jgi:hypothetical protein
MRLEQRNQSFTSILRSSPKPHYILTMADAQLLQEEVDNFLAFTGAEKPK